MDCRFWLVALAAVLAPVATTSQSLAADCNCAPKNCECVSPCPKVPCQESPYYQAPGDQQPTEADPEAPMMPMDDMPMADDLTQPADDLPAMPSPANTFATSTQFASASEAVGFRDATIGDFFGNTARIAGPSYGGTLPENGFNIPIGGGDRRYKIAENVSPIPVNRWFVNYNHFSQPVRNINRSGIDVDRVTLGLEKTFLEGSSSLEVRLPIVGGLDSTQGLNRSGDQTATEFGNMNLVFKSILLQNGNQSALTAGLTLNLPTAADGQLLDGTGSVVATVGNESVHLLPFVAYYRQHSSRTWSTAVMQLDFDVNGTPFYMDVPGDNDITFGRYQEQNFLYLDYSLGHWFYEDCCGCGFVRRAAVIGELHYSTTLNDTDTASSGPSPGDVVTNPFNRIDVLNATAGLRFQLGDNYMLTTAVVAPLKDGENKLFDSEIAVLLTRRY